MSRVLRSAVGALFLAVVVLGFVLAATSTPAGKAVDVFLLYAGGVVLLALVTAASAAGTESRTSEFEAALVPRQSRPERPRELARLEREVDLAEASAFYLHYRLRATLREIAGQRLRAHRGVDIDRDQEAARAALGDETWQLLRSDREPPRFRGARGMPVDQLRTVVDTVENV